MSLPATLLSMLVGLPLLVIAGPMIGEMVATMPPLFFNPQAHLAVTARLPYETVEFQTGEKLTLRGWFFPADRPDAPAIVYAPATSHDQRSGLSLVQPLHAAGYHVLLFSYRGSGNSDGSRIGFSYGALESRDVDAAVDFLWETKGIRNIGTVGHSAGAVSIILSAARNPRIAAVVAASPFPSLEAVWETSRPAFFPKPFYRLIMRMAELRKGFSHTEVRAEEQISRIAPRALLIIQGGADERVTNAQALDLFQRASGPKQFLLLDNASHHEVRTPGLDENAGVLIKFFEKAFSGSHVGEHLPSPILAD